MDNPPVPFCIPDLPACWLRLSAACAGPPRGHMHTNSPLGRHLPQSSVIWVVLAALAGKLGLNRIPELSIDNRREPRPLTTYPAEFGIMWRKMRRFSLRSRRCRASGPALGKRARNAASDVWSCAGFWTPAITRLSGFVHVKSDLTFRRGTAGSNPATLPPAESQ